MTANAFRTSILLCRFFWTCVRILRCCYFCDFDLALDLVCFPLSIGFLRQVVHKPNFQSVWFCHSWQLRGRFLQRIAAKFKVSLQLQDMHITHRLHPLHHLFYITYIHPHLHHLHHPRHPHHLRVVNMYIFATKLVELYRRTVSD